MVGPRKFKKDNKKKYDSRQALKNVLANYIKRHDMHLLAEQLKFEYPTLMRKMNSNDDQDIHACQLVKFIKATQHTWKDESRRQNEEMDFSLLDEIEFRLGRVFKDNFKHPKYDFSFHGLSRLIKESSEATRAISDAFVDGTVTPQEAEACIKELNDLVHVSMQVIHHLEEIERSGKDFKLTK